MGLRVIFVSDVYEESALNADCHLNELQNSSYTNHNHPHQVDLRTKRQTSKLQKKSIGVCGSKGCCTTVPNDDAIVCTSLAAATAAAQAAAASAITDAGRGRFGKHVVFDKSTCKTLGVWS